MVKVCEGAFWGANGPASRCNWCIQDFQKNPLVK